MIDTNRQRPIQVDDGGGVSPSLSLPLSQLDRVRELFDREGIYYWVGETVISFKGRPETAFVYFGRKGDPSKIQAILDRTD